MYSRAQIELKAGKHLKVLEVSKEFLQFDQYDRIISALIAGRLLDDAKRMHVRMLTQGFKLSEATTTALRTAQSMHSSGRLLRFAIRPRLSSYLNGVEESVGIALPSHLRSYAESEKKIAKEEKDCLQQELDNKQEELVNMQKRLEELELKSKANIKVLVKEVKFLRKSQAELKEMLNQSVKEKTELEVSLLFVVISFDH
ncbi:hypothetical protein ZIOFF_035278 [Zingiber officinale]|uniref:Uncharacterized protein n=1 Tax=Zingiber officinale TaxID=94328 RepID=A0A8J5L0K4_ZINOF|nr:hypothetical protein ZIOFF_035278 [Zingiber officinale]